MSVQPPGCGRRAIPVSAAGVRGKRIRDPPEGINGVVAGPNGEGDFSHGDDATQL